MRLHSNFDGIQQMCSWINLHHVSFSRRILCPLSPLSPRELAGCSTIAPFSGSSSLLIYFRRRSMPTGFRKEGRKEGERTFALSDKKKAHEVDGKRKL